MLYVCYLCTSIKSPAACILGQAPARSADPTSRSSALSYTEKDSVISLYYSPNMLQKTHTHTKNTQTKILMRTLRSVLQSLASSAPLPRITRCSKDMYPCRIPALPWHVSFWAVFFIPMGLFSWFFEASLHYQRVDFMNQLKTLRQKNARMVWVGGDLIILSLEKKKNTILGFFQSSSICICPFRHHWQVLQEVF